MPRIIYPIARFAAAGSERLFGAEPAAGTSEPPELPAPLFRLAHCNAKAWSIPMAEVLARYETLLIAGDGTKYLPQAVGAQLEDGRWQAWLEFEPTEEGAALRTSRETTQPNREAAVYWATGLSAVYLEGALARARTPRVIVTPAAAPEPIFDEPRPELIEIADDYAGPAPVLDPFSVYEKGEAVLLNQLGALSPWHLVSIVRAYGFSDQSTAELNRHSATYLVELIMDGVRQSDTDGYQPDAT